jgi:hypothetical protein
VSIVLFKKCGPFEGSVIDSFDFTFRLHNAEDWDDNPASHPTTPQAPDGPFVQYLNYEVMDALNSFQLLAIYLDARPKPGIWTVNMEQDLVAFVSPGWVAVNGNPTHFYYHQIAFTSGLALDAGNFYEYVELYPAGAPTGYDEDHDAEMPEMSACGCDSTEGLSIQVRRVVPSTGFSVDIHISGVWVSDFP